MDTKPSAKDENEPAAFVATRNLRGLPDVLLEGQQLHVMIQFIGILSEFPPESQRREWFKLPVMLMHMMARTRPELTTVRGTDKSNAKYQTYILVSV